MANDSLAPSSPARSSPAFVAPMAARFVRNLPEGAEWTYEQKFDGFRALLLKDGRTVRVRSRSNRDLAWMHPSIVAAARRPAAEQAVVDGEIVALDPNGRPCFQALQHRGAYPQHRIAFYAFDLLHLDGADITCRPLLERRASLSRGAGRPGFFRAGSVARSPRQGGR